MNKFKEPADKTVLLQDQLALRENQSGLRVMVQKWRSLLFLHFSVEPEIVQKTLPKGLTVDTFPDESGMEMAWIGLVPFRMEGVRARGLPPIGSNFPETNLRTYVHHNGRNPGVWFYSLDAANPLACKVARATYGLPYREAKMSVTEKGNDRIYVSSRIKGIAEHHIEATFGEQLGTAEPGTFEFWLLERYILYSFYRGKLYRGHVRHVPYPMRSVTVNSIQQTIVQAAGFEPKPFQHAIASDGVDVDVFLITHVG